MDPPASPFRKRVVAPELPSRQHDGPLILSVSSPTWSALLRAVATALTGPRQLQGQIERQSLRGIEIKLPLEQSSGALTRVSENGADIMQVDSAPMATELQQQPEHAEQSLVVSGISSQVEHPASSEVALTAEPTGQASMQQKEAQHAAEKSGHEAGRHPPARVSRRLEARRWAPMLLIHICVAPFPVHLSFYVPQPQSVVMSCARLIGALLAAGKGITRTRMMLVRERKSIL